MTTDWQGEQLTVIVSTDVRSSTTAMYHNEPEALQQINEARSLMLPLCEAFGGKVIASLGDGLFFSFPSAQQAIAFAILFQKNLFQKSLSAPEIAGKTLQRLAHRVGIHLGEIKTGSEMNAPVRLIAERVQQLAEAGGICCSRALYDSVQSKLAVPFQDIGLHPIQGLPYPMHLYQIPAQALDQFSLTNNLIQPSENSVQLLAVVFTAIEDYESKLIHDPQQLQQLAQRDFQVMTQRYRSFNKRLIKSIGSGLLMIFPSALQAVMWAIKIQKLLCQHQDSSAPDKVLYHRISIHLGDVKLVEQDIAGNTVNIAARLLHHTPAGGICLSCVVYDAVPATFSLPIAEPDSKLVQLKGIPRPHRIYLIPALSANHGKPTQEMLETLSDQAITNHPESARSHYSTGQDVVKAYQQGCRNFSGNNFAAFDFNQEDLSGANLSQCHLGKAQLKLANFRGVNFSRADLVEADLSGTNLQQSYCNYADFREANLQHAQLCQAHLSSANLQGANLCGADLSGARVTDMQLAVAICDHTTIYPEGKPRLQENWLKRFFKP